MIRNRQSGGRKSTYRKFVNRRTLCVCRKEVNRAKGHVPLLLVIPPVGSHVAITGTFVQDTNHQRWKEIHPVSRIVVIP